MKQAVICVVKGWKRGVRGELRGKEENEGNFRREIME